MTEYPLVGDETDDLLTPAVETKLEQLGISIPEPIELPPQPEQVKQVTPSPTPTPTPSPVVEGIDNYFFHGVAEREQAPRWRRPQGLEACPAHVADAAREAGVTVIDSDDDLRQYVEDRGYALVPIEDVTLEMLDKGVGPGETIAPAGNPKDALGMKKPDLSLVPAASSLYQAQAMMDGAAKYGPYNWRSNPVLARVYISAALRHISAFLDGEDIDPISGVPHIGHGLACLGIIADAAETGNLIDDRPVKGPAGDMVRRFNDTQSFKR